MTVVERLGGPPRRDLNIKGLCRYAQLPNNIWSGRYDMKKKEKNSSDHMRIHEPESDLSKIFATLFTSRGELEFDGLLWPCQVSVS